jgi:L-ascorbate metabolism protein UlaG (beta-lactamase superfamily)
VGGHFVLGPKDAAYATRHYLKPKYAIPMHYGTNPRLKGTPEEYIAALGRSATQVLNLKFGEVRKF